jgi:spore maturation protein CgeB
MTIVIIGLSITSSWGNGHASTYRALIRGLASRGHRVVFLERDAPWYAENRDLPDPPYCRVDLYTDVQELDRRYGEAIAAADLVIVGSYVPDGVAAIDVALRRASGPTAFYDIDTPVTLALLQGQGAEYIDRRQIPRFDLYLSFTGGPTLDRLERRFGARLARPLYCSVDLEIYRPELPDATEIDLGYLGTYSTDRQPTLDALLVAPARAWSAGRFLVAGAQYPDTISFPDNVQRVIHLSPRQHPAFYNRSRYTLNITRRAMIASGHSPSVRLFEAAACGTPIISDVWPGLNAFFTPEREILLARSTADVLRYLQELGDAERREIGERGRERVLAAHTSAHRAIELERYVSEVSGRLSTPAAVTTDVSAV